MTQKRTKYQEQIIRNYYRNLDQLLVQRLGEMLSDLYLAEGAKRVRLWKRVGEAMVKLNVPKAEADHIVASDNPALVADLLKKLLEKGA